MKSSDSNYLSAIISQRCIRRESGGPRRVLPLAVRKSTPGLASSLPLLRLTKFLREVSASGIPDGPSPGEGGGIAKGRRAGKDGRDGEGLRFSSGRAASFPQARQEGGGRDSGAKGERKGQGAVSNNDA
jgi:hypothetical protein